MFLSRKQIDLAEIFWLICEGPHVETDCMCRK